MSFRKKPKALINLETDPNIRVSETFKEYYELLAKRLDCLQKSLFDFKMKKLSLLDKERDLVHIISPLISQI